MSDIWIGTEGIVYQSKIEDDAKFQSAVTTHIDRQLGIITLDLMPEVFYPSKKFHKPISVYGVVGRE